MTERKWVFTGSNFVVGKWQNGFGVVFSQLDESTFSAKYTFSEHQQGPPGIAHGGAIATLLDEAMTAVAFEVAGMPAFTVNLNVTYRTPVYVGTEITITARLQESDGRKLSIYAEATLPDGTIATVASGLFIRLA